MTSSRATLTASLLRSAPPPPAPNAAATDNRLFVVKGNASAAQFRPQHLTTAIAATDGPFLFERQGAPFGARRGDGRIWVRVSAAVRLRAKMAADARGQNSRALLAEALDDALNDATPPLAPPRAGTSGRTTKLAFTVDAERRSAIQQAAARCSLTVQAFLRSVIESYLERLAAAEPQLFDPGAARGEIIAFPRPAATPQRGFDAGQRRRRQQAAARLGLRAFHEPLPRG
jgi:hypothetical protein